MNVYLLELDSVRNSPDEIRVGQNALLEQMLLYGNTVVLTMNQLTDSMAFLQAIHDEKKYAVLKRLIELGKIRLSRYREISTNIEYVSASHYMQVVIERNLNRQNEETSYHFSCKFIDDDDKIQMETAYRAIRYANPYEIDVTIGRIRAGQVMEDASQEEKDAEITKLQEMKRYVEVILLISSADTGDLPAKEDISDAHKLKGYFEQVASIYWDDADEQQKSLKDSGTTALSEDQRQILIQAVTLLRNFYTANEALPDGSTGKKDLSSRSVWYTAIKGWWEAHQDDNSHEAETIASYMQMVIDICYDLACEYSISNIDMPISEDGDASDFVEKFEEELAGYADVMKQHFFSWKEKPDNIRFLDPDPNEDKAWQNMLSVVEMNIADAKKVEESDSEKTTDFTLRMQNQKKAWGKLTTRRIHKEYASAILFFLVFMGTQWLANELQDGANDGLEAFFGQITGVPQVITTIIVTLIVIVVFGAVSSLLSNLLKIPDILDSFHLIADIYRKKRLLKKYQKDDD